jgi:hypothetical protein
VIGVARPGAKPIALERPAFDDPARSGPADYLRVFSPPLDAVCRLLRPGGSLYVHLDWRVAAHVRVHLDGLWGHEAVRNELVWRRNPPLGRKARAGQFGRVTDTILFYVRPGGRATFHPLTVVRAAAPGSYRIDAATGGAFRTAPRGDYTDRSVARLEREGRIHRTRSGSVRVRYDLEPGDVGAAGRTIWLERVPVDSLWTDVPDAMHLPLAERTGYATQKPQKLLERIVSASSSPGDVVLDPMCGSGTTLVAAAQLGRRALGADRSILAVHTAFARLARAGVPVRIERLRDSVAADSAFRSGLRREATSAGSVRLLDYRPPFVPEWPGAAEAVAAARATQGLALLEGWGIVRDTSRCTTAPVLGRWLGRDRRGLVPVEVPLPDGGGRGIPHLLAIDVFGNRVMS